MCGEEYDDMLVLSNPGWRALEDLWEQLRRQYEADAARSDMLNRLADLRHPRGFLV